MRVAIVAAKFSGDDADKLRRSMATFRNMGTIGEHGECSSRGMVGRGYDPEFAERCFKQIEGFGSYGFPESHAISFALLVYVSAWVKRASPRRLLRRPAEQPADGLLPAGPAGPRRRAARRRGAAARRVVQRLGLHA